VRFGSACSGIEAATVASAHLGWEPAFYSEIDPFCRSLLSEKYPQTPLYGDFSKITAEQCGPVDAIVGGTPCQDFSVAGKRAGLDGARGNLTLEFVRLVERVHPRWVFWENVPGVLSIDGGRAFGAFLGALGQLGYGWSYRVLDAQHFGVPQRRRRVFVVGYFGGWQPAAAVLFEPESVRGNSPPSREARQGVAPTISARTKGGGGLGTDFDLDGGLIARCLNAGGCNRIDGESETFIPFDLAQITSAVNRSSARPGDPMPPLCSGGQPHVAGTLAASGAGTQRPAGNANETDLIVAHALRADGFDASEDGTGRGTPIVPTIARSTGAGWYTEDDKASVRAQSGGTTFDVLTTPIGFYANDSGNDAGDNLAPTLRSMEGGGGNHPAVAGVGVRRLTPRECERLQGFPDDYTLITHRGKPAADGPRYKALGNSWAVPCVRWIFERMDYVDSLLSPPR
jgi:DNA (cytosine-5)-methyltransferase 1